MVALNLISMWRRRHKILSLATWHAISEPWKQELYRAVKREADISYDAAIDLVDGLVADIVEGDYEVD